MLEIWGMWSTPSLTLLPDPLWPEVVAPNSVLYMGQIELNCGLMLNWTVFDIETVYKKKDWIIQNRFFYMYKNGLRLNDLLGLMCRKTKSNKTKSNQSKPVLIMCLIIFYLFLSLSLSLSLSCQHYNLEIHVSCFLIFSHYIKKNFVPYGTL